MSKRSWTLGAGLMMTAGGLPACSSDACEGTACADANPTWADDTGTTNDGDAGSTGDVQIDAFDLGDLTDVALDTQVQSSTITISGIGSDLTVAVTVEGAELSIDGGVFSNEATTATGDQTVTLQLTSSPVHGTTTQALLTIGEQSDTWTVTTTPRPATENDVAVDINLDVLHSVGGSSDFEREKWITIHSTHTDPDWAGDNFTDDLIGDFLAGYDVYLGRDTGGITWTLNQVAEDPDRPGFADPDDVSSIAADLVWSYQNTSADRHAYEDRNALVVGAQVHPFWPDGTLTSPDDCCTPPRPWALSRTDSDEEPLGTASGEFMGRFVAEAFGDDAQPPPAWVEVMNEPLWELVDQGVEEPDAIFAYHRGVATQIRRQAPGTLVGGYTTAFPDFEVDDFGQWTARWRRFIDTTGDDMDFWSLHIYDFPNFGGKAQYRKGSNVEATLDLLEWYTAIAADPKPLLISEYGSQVHDLYDRPWSPYRDWLCLKAINSLMVQFMQRPHQIAKAIPFIPIKAEWGRIGDDVPYYWRLMRQAKEADGQAGETWVYTDQVKFYELWEDVAGSRVDSRASDLDVQVMAYVDGATAWVILNNLDDEEQVVDLFLFGAGDNTIISTSQRHLYLAGDQPTLQIEELATAPAAVTLGAEATLILRLDHAADLVVDQASTEERHYANGYLLPILGGTSSPMSINDVDVVEHGAAVLRLGLGRDHGQSLQPDVLFNGTPLTVPTDWRGGDQADRDRFFGVIEIDVPYNVVQADNTVTVGFEDAGGTMSSMILQTFSFTRPVDLSLRP